MSAQTPLIHVVNQPRPLAAAAETIEHKFGVVINYEDPAYLFADDILDITAQQSFTKAADAHRTLVPKPGSIVVPVDLPSTGRPLTSSDAAKLISTVVAAHNAAGNAGSFKVLQDDTRFTITPGYVRNARGLRQEVTPVLNTVLSMDEKSGTALDALQGLCAQLSDGGRPAVMVGTVPANLLQQSSVVMSAANEPARAVLQRILIAVEKGNRIIKQRLVWDLFYAPDLNGYVLNIHSARQEQTMPDGFKKLVPVQ